MTIEVMKQALEALEINRIMAKDANGNYTREVTPKKITDAITALRQVISLPDCRLCAIAERAGEDIYFVDDCKDCTNGDKFQALAPVRLYKVTPQE